MCNVIFFSTAYKCKLRFSMTGCSKKRCCMMRGATLHRSAMHCSIRMLLLSSPELFGCPDHPLILLLARPTYQSVRRSPKHRIVYYTLCYIIYGRQFGDLLLRYCCCVHHAGVRCLKGRPLGWMFKRLSLWTTFEASRHL